MDTIIYVYPLREVNKGGCAQSNKKEQQANQKEQQSCRKDLHKKSESFDREMEHLTELYSMEELDMPDYHLVRVGISGELAEICGGNRQQRDVAERQGDEMLQTRYKPSRQAGKALYQIDSCSEQTDMSLKQASSYSKQTGHFDSTAVRRRKREGFWRRRRRKKQQRAEQQREQELLADFLHQIWKDQEQSFFVCEEVLPFFNRWEFNGYFEASWVKHMLRYAGDESQAFMFPHFLILGQTRCLPEILYPGAVKMKSLKWVLPARQFREELQELVEDIYEEYGLAVDVHLLEDEDAYRRTRISCPFPTVVLDFSESDRVPTADIAKGSVWLDMASSEEKRRRIEERNTGIHYFSLKKEWKQPQKALFHLDTTSKNGYNT